jgi:hypothetical protein
VSAYHVPVAGGAAQPIFDVGAASELAVAAGKVYLVQAGSKILRFDGGSFDFTTLASGSPLDATDEYQAHLSHIEADADRIYYREENGALGWVKDDGTDCRIVFDVATRITNDNAWAMSATAYYFILDQREIYEVPR